MVAHPSHPQRLTVAEWRELEQHSEMKHEYIDGHIYDMSGGTLNHSLISLNAAWALKASLQGKLCRVYNTDAAVRLSSTRYVYPDATVTCDEQDYGYGTEVRTPTVVVEVLSDSTEAYDRGEKLRYYRVCPSIQECVIIATKYQTVEVFRRTPEGWTTYHAYEPGDTVELSSIGVSFAVAALYEGTDVPASPKEVEGQV